MTTAYTLLPALVEAHPGQCAAFYAEKLQHGQTSVGKALARLARNGIVVGVLEEGNLRGHNRLLYYPADEIELPPPVQRRVASWAPERIPPGPRSIFDLATCGAL